MYIPCINKDTDAHPECRVSDQVNKFLAATSDINHQIIWIKISANDDEKCKWTNDINFNCQRTQDIANYLKVASNKKIGYFSTQEDWIKIYGDKYGCSEASDLYNFYPLYYKYLDDQPNTKEFLDHKFGTFGPQAMKMYKTTDQCNAQLNINILYPENLSINL
ncbi:lysozyme protein (macronuclear) [Tetrahymena thermophila SB210]|uniref:Lysozyme protein n=1 Tax=Tetrahymena thermophila (strain SB210) TaxID=312017 RepID=Q227H2_TETTS|nr:lysozyme protein [Tetrahymena thermophila SB210]EAR81438.4 lysozyme protein [Tetrahymena thermophila SB210]|eukprot:XP_001029101.4 lysozyme protein [Tetrahymena thermophila SB210]